MLDVANLKPSDVLQAMVNGLLKTKSDPLFEVDMGTFGMVKQEICYGCGASVALAEMFGTGQSASELMRNLVALGETPPIDPLGLSSGPYFSTPLSDCIDLKPSYREKLESIGTDLYKLERVVNNVRLGDVTLLICLLLNKTDESFDDFDDRWSLGTDNWEKQLPEVEKTIAEMREAGY
jgi:hypothetical protein